MSTSTLAQIMFIRDTITGRMLRTLALRGEMPQAEFMDLYHVRCARKNPGRSSFQNNFGRYVKLRKHGSDHGPTVDRHFPGPGRCIVQERIDESTRNRLTFTPFSNKLLFDHFTAPEFSRAEQAMERRAIQSGDREDMAWLTAIRAEILIRNASLVSETDAVARLGTRKGIPT